MAPGFHRLLHREPRLYDLVFPDTDDSIGRMCREAFRRYLPVPPASALDIGCGTGRHLDALARLLETTGFEALGVYDNRDFQPSDLTGAISAAPDVGGMRGRKLYAFARRR
jgi:SAM-dependent methyltransferase